jgi:outer membrane protein OmpA-like peptidoglycan-associated protein
MLPDHILFDFNQTIIRAGAYDQLESLANFMENNKNVELEIIGYTCTVGSASYNKGLSERRAQAVLEFLLHKNIARERIQAIGKGESNPVGDNNTDEGKKENRRVEFVIDNILEDR